MARETIKTLSERMSNLENRMDAIETAQKQNNEDTAFIKASIEAFLKGEVRDNANHGEQKPKPVKIKDFKPVTKKGGYDWKSYKTCRSMYCYATLGCTVTRTKVVSFPEGYVFDEEKWAEAKSKFEAEYKYVKVADR